MAHINEIQFRMGEEFLKELEALYVHNKEIFVPADDDELGHLLKAHLWDMSARLGRINRSAGRKTVLSMTLSETLAFWQYWTLTDTSEWPLANVIILDMIKKIDKKSRKS